MGILHPREQNFHPAKCSTIFNRLNIWEQAPGANWANLKTIPRVYWHVQNGPGGRESNKKSLLSFMTSWNAVMPLAEEVCTTPPKGIDFFFQSLKRERGRGEERGRISPGRGGGVFPYKRLIGKCRWMGLHFHDWSDYNGVPFSIDLLEWGRKFSDFWSK